MKKNQQLVDIKYGSPVIKKMAPFPHALNALSLDPFKQPLSLWKKKTASRFLQNGTLLSEKALAPIPQKNDIPSPQKLFAPLPSRPCAA